MASPVVVLATALLLSGFSSASPIISFPINSQVPPVARVGEPFAFVFSPSTFSSGSPITYSLSNPPRWLSVDSGSRLLFGTPSVDDISPGRVVGVPLNLVATDYSGSTTLAATLVVSPSLGPKLEIPFSEQVPGFGTFSGPSAVLSTPDKAFAFQLDPNTFSKPSGAPVSYYATMADNTPLPAWMFFDPSRLSFTGRTPPSESLIQPPQTFSFQVIASDVVGFAGASLGFKIVVGSHRLSANETTIVVNATTGIAVSFTGLMGGVTVDGNPAAPESVTIVSTPNLPRWLSLNNRTGDISGVAPQTAESTNFTITLRDIYFNVLNLTVVVELTGGKNGLFTGNLPQFTIIPGKPFSVDLRPYLSRPQDTKISIKTNSSYPWIHFNPGEATLFGDAPGELKESSLDIQIQARSKNSKQSASVSLDIAIRAASGGEGSTLTHPTTTGARPTESPNGQLSWAGDSDGNGRFNPMLLAVLLSLLLLLALAVCALFWYFRRRKVNQRPALSTRDISSPLPGTFVTRTPGPGVAQSLPDFTKRFGKSFSADEIFSPDKKKRLDPRNAFLTRPELPPPVSAAGLLPPSPSACSDPGASTDSDNTPVAASGALMALRPGTRGKISSSLSSITEKSIAELVDSRGLDLVGADSRRSFRDKIEINVPRLTSAPGLAFTGSPSPTEAMSTPRPGSSQTVPETALTPLRTEASLSYHPPTSAVRKLSWPWLRGVKGKRQGSRLVPGMKRVSEQPSVLTVDTAVSEKPGQPSPTVTVFPGDSEKETTVLESSSLPLPRFPSRAPIDRPPIKSRRAMSETLENPIQEKPNTSGAVSAPAIPGSGLLMDKEDTTPGFPPANREATRADSLDIYDGITEHNPFRPSRTWSTVPTTDDWADETVESLALSRSASQHQQNWTVLQESPVIKTGDTTATGGLPDVASSLRLPQVREGGGEGGGKGEWPLAGPSPFPSPATSRPGTAATLEGRGARRERSGLTRKSQSRGVSLRSEGTQGTQGTQGTDYAVFI